MYEKKTKIYNDIVRVLSNSYYELYMIHLEQGQYEMLKGPYDIQDNLPVNADFSKLREKMKKVIAKEDCEKFLEIFSIENMNNLVKKKIRDFGGDFRRRFKDEYRWVHVQMLYDESLGTRSVVLCFKDINEVKKQELSRLEVLQSSLNSVDKMSKSRNMFFSQMSHDMRTPLNGIIGLTKLALDSPDDVSRMRNTLDTIMKLSDQLLSLINDILSLSRLESGKLELRTDKFYVRNNLEELVSIYKAQAEVKGRDFIAELSIEDSYVKGDWGRIQQILNNLLSNAFKFTTDDGKIKFSVNEVKDYKSRYRKYYFTVSDNGVGMSKEFLEKIFLPFERETQFGAANVSGTGLGMSIVYEIVQKMNGTIHINSELGKGSTFEVMVPCGISKKQEVVLEEKKVNDTVWDLSKSELNGKRVLLVEDNEINMEIASEVLKSGGLEVIKAWNGKEALEQFEKNREGYFDLILMDMHMPVMDGCKATEAIRNTKKSDALTIPVIAVTANACASDISLIKQAGMNTHIRKPIDFEIFKKTVTEVLNTKLSGNSEKIF